MAQVALGGISIPSFEPVLDGGSFGRWNISSADKKPSINLREVIRESSREKESVYTRDRRPIVVLMQGQGSSGSYEDVVDQALRQLEMRGGS